MATISENLPASCPPIINVSTVDELTDTQRNLIYHYITENGCLIIQESSCPDANSSLSNLGDLFGAPIFHNMSDEQGIFPMCYMPGFDEYANATCTDVQLHTDGTFEKKSPELLLLHCEQPDITGGNTKIALADNVYAYLQQKNPSMIDGLFLEDAFTVKRDDRKSANAIFKNVKGYIHTTFRSGSDVQIIVNEIAREGFREICNYLAEPANYTEIRLEKHQTLILDNTRVLHGRTSFPETSSRKLCALWCNADKNTDQFYLGFQPV